MICCLIYRDKHRVVLFGVEDFGGYEAWAYIAKYCGYALHAGVLRESYKIATLHALCCRIGGCRAHAHGAGNRCDNGDMCLMASVVARFALYIV